MEKPNLVDLRKTLDKEDAINLIEWLSDDDIIIFMNEDKKIIKFLEQILENRQEVLLTYYLNQRNIFYMIDYQNEPVGFVSLKPKGNKKCEIVIAVGKKDLWGKKVGKRSLNKILKLAFENFEFEELEAKIHYKNLRSLSLFKNNGFKQVKAEESSDYKKLAFTEKDYYC